MMVVQVVEAATLGALLQREELRLRLHQPDAIPVATNDLDVLDRPVRGVHSSDLLAPTPFLAQDLVLLTTGTQFEPAEANPEFFHDYVRRLRDRGVAALGFGTEVVRDGIPAGLASACTAHELPLFEVPYRTPFIAVARANSEALAAEAYARRSWALSAQRAISLAALRPDGLGATIAELARQLDTWVGLFDTGGTLTREAPRGGQDAASIEQLRASAASLLQRGARAGVSVEVGGRNFSLQTLGRGGSLRGIIALATDGLDQEGRGVVTSVIALASLALEQNDDLARAHGLLRAGVLHSLLSNDKALAARISRQIWGELPVAPLRVAVLDAPATRIGSLVESLELRVDERRGRLFFARHEGTLVLCIEEAELALVEQLSAVHGLHAGVSEPSGYDALAQAHEQARVAWERSREGSARVALFASIASDGVLAYVAGPQAREVGLAALAPLHQHDAEHDTELVRTLRAWLEADAVIEAAARTLGVHRHTVRARIGLAERLLQRDLGGFAARADVWAALVATR